MHNACGQLGGEVPYQAFFYDLTRFLIIPHTVDENRPQREIEGSPTCAPMCRTWGKSSALHARALRRCRFPPVVWTHSRSRGMFSESRLSEISVSSPGEGNQLRFASSDRRGTTTLLWAGLVILAWVVLATVFGSSQASANEVSATASSAPAASHAHQASAGAQTSKPAKNQAKPDRRAKSDSKSNAGSGKKANAKANAKEQPNAHRNGNAHPHAHDKTHPHHNTDGHGDRSHKADSRASTRNPASDAPHRSTVRATPPASVVAAPAAKAVITAQNVVVKQTSGSSASTTGAASDEDLGVHTPWSPLPGSERAASATSNLSVLQAFSDVTVTLPAVPLLSVSAADHADSRPIAGPASTADCAPD